MTKKEARAVIEAMILERQKIIEDACMGGPSTGRLKAAREIEAITTMLPSTLTPLKP